MRTFVHDYISPRLSHGIAGKTRQPRLFRAAQPAKVPAGCPTAFKQYIQMAIKPQCGPDIRDQTGKAMGPVALPSLEPQEQMDEQGRPDLPFDRVGGLTHEVHQLHGLLQLFEKRLNRPPALVQIADAGGGPFRVVGQEDHLPFLAVDFDQGGYSPQEPRILFLGGRSVQFDQFILEDALVRALGQAFLHRVVHVVLRPGDEEDPALFERPQVNVVDVGFVKNHDFSLGKPGAQLFGADAVVLLGGIDNGKARQATGEIHAQMALGRGLPPPMLRPAHARRDQLDGRRVHHVDGVTKTPGEFSAALAETGEVRLQMIQHRPEQLLGHRTVPHLVRVAERVARRRPRSSNRAERSQMQSQRVAHVVQAPGVGDLRIEHRYDVAPSAEGALLQIDASLPRELRHQMIRNELAELAQHGNVPAVRLYRGSWVHHLRYSRPRPCSRTAFFRQISRIPVGR